MTIGKLDPDAYSFYRSVLTQLQDSGIPFLVGGGFAFCHYTGLSRYTKDLDIFCTPAQGADILKYFGDLGYRTELTDIRWLAKVFKDDMFMDIIFDSPNNICAVDDTWYRHSTLADFDGIPIRLLPIEELIWCKTYVMNRERYDGSDINHLLLKQGHTLHWHLLLSHLLVFQFVYPSEHREIIPRRIMDHLLERARQQYELPSPMEKVCRGPLIDQTQYAADIVDWQYKVTTIKTI
jgi:hypothetical protein